MVCISVEYSGIREAEVQEKAEVVDGETDENEVQKDLIVEPTQPDDTAESPGTLLSDEQPSQERDTSSSERQKLREEEELDPEEVRKKRFRMIIRKRRTRFRKKLSRDRKKNRLLKKSSYAILIKEVEEFSADFEKPSLESKSEESGQVNLQFPATEAKELSPEEIERIMDRGKTWGVHGLTKKEQVVYRSEIARLKADRLEVRRVLDKEFDKGIDSLTDEERVVYEQEQARRTERRRRNKKSQTQETRSISINSCSDVSFSCGDFHWKRIRELLLFLLSSDCLRYPPLDKLLDGGGSVCRAL